jgi:type II secretion system protein C
MKFRSVLIVIFINILLMQLTPHSFALENKADGLISSFKLLGTILEPDSSSSIAVLKDTNSEKQSIVKIGDKIFGYQVAKIKRGEVMLLKEGKTFILGFPLGSVVQPIVVVSSQERIVNRIAISKKIPDLNMAGTKVIPVPCVKDGKIIGIKIAKIQDKELGRLSGIEEGDVITNINNERLDTIKKALEVLHNIQDKDKIFVEIKRGKDIKNLVFHIN